MRHKRNRRSRPSPRKWQCSDYSALISIAPEYQTMMSLAYDHAVYAQVLHNGHILIELYIKGALSKDRKKHPWGHSLIHLVGYKVVGVSILESINEASNDIQDAFTIIYSAWEMQYRYKVKRVSQVEAKQYLNAFNEASKWIKKTYVL